MHAASMLELADIVRAAGPAYRAAHAGPLLPSHERALADIATCRTPALGGSLYQCDDCGALEYRYHSCRNRHCPTCQEDRAQGWLDRTRARLRPCDHYLLTFTLPAELRAVARAHHRVVYAALLREAAAGGLTPDGAAWVKPAHPRFLVPGYRLSEVFRAKDARRPGARGLGRGTSTPTSGSAAGRCRCSRSAPASTPCAISRATSIASPSPITRSGRRGPAKRRTPRLHSPHNRRVAHGTGMPGLPPGASRLPPPPRARTPLARAP